MRGDLGLLLAVVAASAIGLAGEGALPLLTGSLMDTLGLDPPSAGLLASFELGAVALASLLLASRIHHLSRRNTAIVGAAVAILGHVVSSQVESYPVLLLARAVAGLGEGAALAAANAAAARARDPDRFFAGVSIVAGLGGAALLGLLPRVIEPFGYAGAFLVLAVLCALMVPLLGPLGPATHGPGSPVVLRPRAEHAVPLLLAMLLLSGGEGALWAFTERIGVSTGLTSAQSGLALAATTLAGLSGAALAVWLGRSTGRRVPIAAGLLTLAAATGGLGHVTSPSAYVVLLMVWGVSFFFTMPYMLGVAASLDPGGRVTAAASGMSSIGMAVGPATAGLLVTRFGFPGIGWLVVVCACATLVLVLPVVRALERRAREPRPPLGAR